MTRLRYNGLRTTLGASLTNSATSVTFAAALTHSNGTNVPTITGSDYIPLVILDASGHESEIVWLTAYTSGATTGTIGRGKEGTTGVAHSSGDTVIQTPTAADVTGVGIIACTSYNPGTLATKTPTTTSADVDSTNLAASFTVPPSGKVLVVLDALIRISAGASVDYLWNLRSGGSDVSGSLLQVWDRVSPDNSNQRLMAQITITGLTPGASLTWTWGHYISATATVSMFIGGTNAGPATMTIHALP